jgi:hypothetical protein
VRFEERSMQHGEQVVKAFETANGLREAEDL